MEYQYFAVHLEDHIAQVTINRPEKANALNLPAWEEMRRIFDDLNKNTAVRVIILRGEGKHFCAGIDLETLMNLQNFTTIKCEGRKREALRNFILNLQDTITAMERCCKPVLAAIHKACVGGGLDIVSACDMRYCTEDAYFSIKEIDLGLVADLGSLQRLPQLLPPGIVAEMAYTGRKVRGAEAAQIGLVNRCFDSREAMDAEVRQLAKMIASKSPLCVRGIKEVLLHKRDHSVPDSLHYMAAWNASMFFSNDLMEAFQANMEKRSAEFAD